MTANDLWREERGVASQQASFRGAMQTRTSSRKSTENFFLLLNVSYNEVMVSTTGGGSFDT